MLKRFIQDEQGQDVIEWGMLAAFLSTLLIVCVSAIDNVIDGWYDTLQTDVTTAGQPL
jgi:Flp pilus assembly pilin Flp